MNPIKSASKWLLATLVIVSSGCVDETFRIDEVSTEVTIADGTTVLPLGKLEKMTLADMLGETQIEGVVKGDDGTYAYSYSGEGEPQTIDGIQSSFTVPGAENRFTVDYPSFNLDMAGVEIDAEDDIQIDNLSSLTSLLHVESGTLPESLVSTIPNVEGSFNRCFEGDDMHLILDLPEEIDNVKSISFRDVELGHHGAPMHLTVDFNGFAGINGGGVVNFQLGLTGGKFRIVDENNELICFGNEYRNEYSVEPGQEQLDFIIYVESIENEAMLNSEHQLDLPIALTCDMTFDLQVKAGNFDLEDLPHFALLADFEYDDAEIVMNKDMSLVEYHPQEPQRVNINNLPAELKSINSIELADNTSISFYADGLEWLGDVAEDIAVEVILPEYLTLHALSGAGYEYDEQEHKLMTTIADINDGVELNIERLDFGAEGLSPEDGTISLDLGFDINAHFVGDGGIKVSALKHDEKLEIVTGIEDITLDVKSVSGRVDYTYTIEQEFKIKMDELNIGDVEIVGVGLSPVITINIDNPLTIPLVVEGELSDDTGRSLELDEIVLHAATYENGCVVPMANKIVIANRRPDYDCTYVEVDFDELIAGEIPSLLSVKLDVGVDSDEVQTLYVANEFNINYDYSIELPVAVNDKLNVTYADSFGGFGDMFAQVAAYDVHVGDVVIVAEVENTTPLAFEAEVTLLDKDGDEVDLIVEFESGYGRVNGSADGKSAEVSTLRLNIANGEGGGLDVAKLATVDGIEFRLVAMSDAEGDVALNAEQWVAAKLMLELAGGVTIDVMDFIKK